MPFIYWESNNNAMGTEEKTLERGSISFREE